MSIHVALRHITHYKYDVPVHLGPQVVRLRPAPHCRTPILSYSLKVQPQDHFINWQQDPQSNYLARYVFEKKTTEFRVEVELVAEMAVYNPFDFFLEPSAEHFPFAYDPLLSHELEPFLLTLDGGPKFEAFLVSVKAELAEKGATWPTVSEPHSETASAPQGAFATPHGEESPFTAAPKLRTIDFLVHLNQRLKNDIAYLIRLEPGFQSPDETLTKGSGSCRDSAWLLCQTLRHLGIAARFVSGYLIQLKPDVKSLDGPSGADQDFTDLHAWCEVYLPGAGWVGLDPTSGLLAGEGHIPLAATPDPQSAAPITGAVDEAKVEFHFEMAVTRIAESPRVTKPYTDEQWQEIEALGRKIDERLLNGDVRLTMGGEPTFVSIDDMDGEEWNTAAVGPTKRLLSGELIKRLRTQFSPGGFLHYGQGKWYPGEPLPRWALGCYWRKDGVAMWENDALIADESKDYGHKAQDARNFALTLAAALGMDSRFLTPAYEDVYYYLWKERRLPANVDPLQSNLKDEIERKRLARIFEQGLGEVVGYAMPLKRDWSDGELTWLTGPWFLRDETLYLIPGDSPMGLRLPLDSLPWVKESEYPWEYPADPFRDLAPLAQRTLGVQPNFLRAVADSLREVPRGGQGRPEPRPPLPPLPTPEGREPQSQESASWIVRTAICFEPRDGRLHVFLPPVTEIQDYLDLVAAVEATAAALDMPIVVEGETPPCDPRINVIKVTPDPGVIEVNMHPAHSWSELVHNTTTLYEEARLTRLGTEKFMLDGRHTGTGGGNHIVMGGATPPESPLLRRPDLLKSLLTYWQHHPSLSYLFSGLFIGSTSQHPRVDEARHETLRELEIGFNQVPTGGQTPPWIVDRVFRDLLADMTGNTHRTEFSIDKLFSPDSSSGRLGLVELRSFEMPPHPKMSLAQHLLLRAAISRFWNEPYEKPLVRWGTELHDRFMLPHFVWQDFEDVLIDMGVNGYEIKPEWFAPHFEFRFPSIGSTVSRGVNVELRTALEPWNVMGEDAAAGGAARYVDSSLERLQVKVQGMIDPRFVLSCNGRRVPLHPTGTRGEFVAGVRYRAWQPPRCLQPTIGIHSPLTFDLLDTWSDRSMGGCSYHVVHPGGRGYDTFPVNAYEAESRRLSRFFTIGHTQGRVVAPEEKRDRDLFFTLDLRT